MHRRTAHNLTLEKQNPDGAACWRAMRMNSSPHERMLAVQRMEDLTHAERTILSCLAYRDGPGGCRPSAERLRIESGGLSRAWVFEILKSLEHKGRITRRKRRGANLYTIQYGTPIPSESYPQTVRKTQTVNPDLNCQENQDLNCQENPDTNKKELEVINKPGCVTTPAHERSAALRGAQPTSARIKGSTSEATAHTRKLCQWGRDKTPIPENLLTELTGSQKAGRVKR